MTTDFVQKFESEPDKKRQKNMTNTAWTIKLSIYKKSANSQCFVIEISENTYSLLTT